MEAQKRNKIIVNGILIIITLATACTTIGLLNALDRNKFAVRTFVIGLAVLAGIYASTKQKTVHNIIENTEPHKAIKWTCGIIIALFVITVIIFIFAGGTLMILNGFMSLYQAIF